MLNGVVEDALSISWRQEPDGLRRQWTGEEFSSLFEAAGKTSENILIRRRGLSVAFAIPV